MGVTKSASKGVKLNEAPVSKTTGVSSANLVLLLLSLCNGGEFETCQLDTYSMIFAISC